MNMTYNEAIEYIHGINWVFCKPGLERIGELCRLLGNPQKGMRFIHVAGTNGKGSFCSMLDSVLRKQGYRTGLFTSPYVRVFNERMRYCGENISDGELAEITSYVRRFADGMQEKPTEFELITAIAFEFFKRKGCDAVILEAGMGGRLDSTNIIEDSLVSVITGIALDHTAYLGDTEEKIAAEKAGIIKRGCPVLYGGSHDGAAEVIKAKANESGATFTRTDRSAISVKSADLRGTVFDYRDTHDIEINLLGLYQPLNAANVIECVNLLNSRGFTVSKQSLYEGLRTASWQARFEIIHRDLLMLFDGGHNPEGVDAAIRTVRRYFGDQKLRIITGVMADKDYMGMVKDISSVAAEVFTVKPGNPRALDAEALAERYRGFGVPARAFPTVEDAVKAAIKASEHHGSPVDANTGENPKDAVNSENNAQNSIPTLALGSLYMYCEVMDVLDKLS
ncbi:MAG: bifunctional folylpolyglutamate synthase/dihydrofolate synthase [Clostridia bacterium]|nr:bifunctional folylpolyglutamate synthase/dihydrofolate synthase [Clostridia bacterium]